MREKQMSDLVIKLRRLHGDPTPLRLPNAWDAGSARLFESSGATAIATTSAGVAWALGYSDGRKLPIDETVALARRLVRVLNVPLSMDIENGYSDNPQKVAENTMRLVDVGVAGINIEDGPDNPTLLASKIEAIRKSVSKAGTDLFVNARSDVFLASLVEPERLIDEATNRGLLYASVGADGLFLPAIVQPTDIRAIVEAVRLPLNVMARPGLVDAGELGKLGVRRLSAGAGIAQVVWGQANHLAREFTQEGRSETLVDRLMSYPEIQALFENS
jgi:2-methylisocitrate lyase-like PEP mutase family enzyme